jgi:hypothetical protein
VVGLGLLYTLAGAARFNFLFAALTRLWSTAAVTENPVSAFGQGLSSVEGPGLLLFALPVIFLVPLAEELTFRGLLQPALAGWLGPPIGIGVASVLFAALHWHYGFMTPQIVFYGAVLGWARHTSGGLRAPILLHALVNGISFLPLLA